MFPRLSYPAHLGRAMLAGLALWLTIAPADAGLTRSIRGPEPIAYVQTPIHSARSGDLQAYWKDEVELIDWTSARGVTLLTSRFHGPHDQELVITVLDAAGVCGIRECPVRIYDMQGGMVLETSACDQSSFHDLTPDRSVFIGCGVAHRIEPDAAARDTSAAAATRRFWHNGSIVEAAFGAGNSVTIRYLDPKDSLPSYLRGLVLFEGRIERGGGITGTAYTFKTGCVPAPYAVAGALRAGNLALSGASPTRDPRSCAVTGYSNRSPNTRLNFIDLTLARAATW